MIVDDDADDRNLFCEALMEANPHCQFITGNNGEHALEILKRPGISLPDFIFLDINMPRMNGWQCLKLLREDECCQFIPVIIYSTSQASDDFEKIKELGSVYFFTKPARFADLVRGIFYVLNKEWEELKKLNQSLTVRL